MAAHLIVALLLLTLATQPALSPQQKAPASKTPYVEKSEKEFAFYPGGKLEISAAAPGSIRVTGWPKAAMRVEIEKILYYGSPDEAPAAAKLYPVRVTNTATSARITTTGPKQRNASIEVNVAVFVPSEKTDLNVSMVKGDLAAAGLNGGMEVTLEEGNIEARNLSGYFSGLTKLGNLTVELSGPRWTGYGFAATTRRGSVDLRLPADYSATLQLETKDGKISVDYPEQIVQGESVPLQVMEKKKARGISAPIGTGGAQIKLMTLVGDIVLRAAGKAPEARPGIPAPSR